MTVRKYWFVICIFLAAVGLLLASYLPDKRSVRTLEVPINEVLSHLDRSESDLLLETFPAGYLESCRVALSTRFPESLRTGSRSGISQEIQLRCPEEFPPGVDLSVEARIDKSTQWILPDGSIQTPVKVEKPAGLTWVVIPVQAGSWNASLWTYLVFSFVDGQKVTLPLSSIPLEGRSLSFLGMDHPQIQRVGLILAGIGFVLFVLIKFVLRRKAA